MKNIPILAIPFCLLLASCGEDRSLEFIEKTAPDKWIESVMVDNYYWYTELNTKSLNYFNAPAAFFSKLLPSKDKISYLEDPANTESLKSYGIEFTTEVLNDSAYAIKVMRVHSDSPAQQAGLERGDWIVKRNYQYIIKNRIDSLLKGSAITLTRADVKVEKDESGEYITFHEKDIIKMGAARKTSDAPIQHAAIYLTSQNKIVGYLAYNSFTPGRSENDATYDNVLRTISNSFAGRIDEMILDLRYNTGGDLKSAHLLGSLLAPDTALDKLMFHLKYNDKQSARDTTWMFSRDVIGSGSNLNLSKLYVITSSNTGSTSEVLINALKPFMQDIVIIGRQTKGIFTTTHPYKGEYPFTLHIADCLIRNANGHPPTSGYTPNFSINELNYLNTYPIGSTNELLLYATLYIIDNGELPEDLR